MTTSDVDAPGPNPDPMESAAEGEEQEEVVVLNPDKPKVIQWDDLQQELARLCSLTSALKKANDRKDAVALALKSLIETREASLRQSNELEEMRQKLEERKLAMGDLLLRTKKAAEHCRTRREKLVYELRLLLLASKKISAANHKLQEANASLAGERGSGHLQRLQRALQARQQHMVVQVSSLYAVKASVQHFMGETDGKPRNLLSLGDSADVSSANVPKLQLSSLTILGLHPTAFPLRKSGFFSDKKEAQRSAAALGYVAHAVLLIASYLDVPLRYPIRLGGSRSYVHDYAASIESTTTDLAPNVTTSAALKPTEFPLFLEGQDSTRAAYAVFLLNKDLEQLLNYIGAQSLGPRHVLANLRELIRIVLSEEFIDR